jgi:hypothetical protein
MACHIIFHPLESYTQFSQSTVFLAFYFQGLALHLAPKLGWQSYLLMRIERNKKKHHPQRDVLSSYNSNKGTSRRENSGRTD